MADSAENAPLTRGHKKKERTRRLLIAAAVDVIAERGEAFTISDVATAAGMANGTFYNYFDDRDELIDAVVPEVLGAFAAESALTVPHEDPAVRFATISALLLTRAAATPDSIRVVLRLDAVQKAIADGGAIGHLSQDVLAGVAAGRFSIGALEAALDVIIGTLLMAARRTVEGEVGQDYHRDLIAQLLRSLGVEAVEAVSIADQATISAAELHDQLSNQT